jgi:hypothetical protein
MSKKQKPVDELAGVVLGTGRVIEKVSMVVIFVALSALATVAAWFAIKWMFDHWRNTAIILGYTAVVTALAIWKYERRP